MYYILFFYNLITNFRLAIRDITLIFLQICVYFQIQMLSRRKITPAFSPDCTIFLSYYEFLFYPTSVLMSNRWQNYLICFQFITYIPCTERMQVKNGTPFP